MFQLGSTKKRRALPACLMRAGTSKGLFINRRYLPASQDDWERWILAAMGSNIDDGLQIDGVGGATPTTSKVAVVSRSDKPGIDLEFVFGQVGIKEETVDFIGTCGNMISGAGPFAIDEGLIKPPLAQDHVGLTILDSNTLQIVFATVPLNKNGSFREEGSFRMPGVPGTMSEIKIAFHNPAGSATNELLPTGSFQDVLIVADPGEGLGPCHVPVSLIDAGNPFVLVDARVIPIEIASVKASPIYARFVEHVRQAGAVKMGLAESLDAASESRSIPKVALLWPPAPESPADVYVESYSVGRRHPSVQLTGLVCIGAAFCAGEVVTCSERLRSWRRGWRSQCDALTDTIGKTSVDVHIAHAAGISSVSVTMAMRPKRGYVEACVLSRTVRKLFDGKVFFYA